MTPSASPIRSVGDLRHRHAVVLGLARSGVAACRFLADVGAEVTAYDRRPASELREAVAALEGRAVHLALGVEPAEARTLLEGADLLVTSPSVSPRFPTTDPWLRDALTAAIGSGAELVSEVGLFLRLTRARLVGVTGTKGKTTTASVLAAMLGRAGMSVTLGGNIGTPLIERVEELGEGDWVVLELSELQLPTIDRGVDVALYTNVAADHLDRHGSVAAYRAVKARLAELSAADGRIVLNADDPGCRELAIRLPGADHAWYGLEAEPVRGNLDATVVDGWITVAGERLLPASDVPLPGRHMVANVLGAALTASLVGADGPSVAAAVRDFPGVPHRLETVAERDGVRWINDSQATIPDAAIAALGAFDAPLVVIAGGKDKGLDYRRFADEIARRARACVLVGETAVELERLVAGRVPVRLARSMTEAVEVAATLARPGDVALLSPAAASFDMFADYAARGDAFRAAVEQLGEAR